MRKDLGFKLHKDFTISATQIVLRKCHKALPSSSQCSQFLPKAHPTFPSSSQSLPVQVHVSSKRSRSEKIQTFISTPAPKTSKRAAGTWGHPKIWDPPSRGIGNSQEIRDSQEICDSPRKFGIPPEIQEFGVSSQGILVPPRTLGPPRSFGTPGFWEFCPPRAHPARPSSPSGTSKGFRGGGRSGAGFWGGPPGTWGAIRDPQTPRRWCCSDSSAPSAPSSAGSAPSKVGTTAESAGRKTSEEIPVWNWEAQNRDWEPRHWNWEP